MNSPLSISSFANLRDLFSASPFLLLSGTISPFSISPLRHFPRTCSSFSFSAFRHFSLFSIPPLFDFSGTNSPFSTSTLDHFKVPNSPSSTSSFSALSTPFSACPTSLLLFPGLSDPDSVLPNSTSFATTSSFFTFIVCFRSASLNLAEDFELNPLFLPAQSIFSEGIGKVSIICCCCCCKGMHATPPSPMEIPPMSLKLKTLALPFAGALDAHTAISSNP